MGHNISTEKRRTALVRLPLTDLADWHMLVTCPSYKDERAIAVAMLIKLTGEVATLASVIPRLRCRFTGCRQAPSLIRVRNRYPVHPGPPLAEVVLRGPGAY